MMKSNIKLIIVLVVIISVLAVVTYLVNRQAKNQINEVTLATFSNDPNEGSYTDLNGNIVSLDQYLGNILVVNSWASWSPFSVTDLPLLAKLTQEFDPNQVTFLAINRKETREQAARFLGSLPALGNLSLVLDPRDHFYTSIGGYAMPEVVIYNKKGEIVNHFRGDANESNIKESINQLLNSN